ncbi:MAG: hypothetical protein LBM04_01735 [Opitutaceae bacterium]|jgi:hypothetical protein|nr:hypothetical protein [Opitutaceae bacterium]
MTTLTKQQFSKYIRAFDFHGLLNHMGWDNDATPRQTVKIDDIAFALAPIVQKNGFHVLKCPSVPDYAMRRKIEIAVEKLFHEHLIIYTDGATEQIWQLVVRESGKPARVSETRWHRAQDPELLYQRASGMVFALDEEDAITIMDVRQRVISNLQQNTERITKRFYDFFKKEHDTFARGITGIATEKDRAWYASLMLNRLMFCYFIQKRGFLNNDKNYLNNKLAESRQNHGADRFYSFYRDFLLVLFHDGLGSPHENKGKLRTMLGDIPYLNGGLFDIHELERDHTAIAIPDDAFEKLFAFFDQWEWHLDTRPDASGREINPDVLGYIFEKYINDRAAMGAYYTKEDITEYIAKNCIIPFLFGDANNAPARSMVGADVLRANPDRYIYPAMLHGADKPMPLEIAAGLADVSKRTHWNRPAPSEYALPTEIWREVVDRRKRLESVRAKIAAGEITAINDFITHNLDIRQFAQDAVENTGDLEFLRAFWKRLPAATILDPTCGSGAFLFAALNILEPLYEAALQRMEAFVADADRAGETRKFPDFRETLKNVRLPAHSNRQYFIYKSIILNNLHGVDIMREAVEIAKLRLFLKLVSTVDPDRRKPNYGLEPLPDMDFNIRAGNTLVGFATKQELDDAFATELDLTNQRAAIEEKCEMTARAFTRYKQIQLSGGNDERHDAFKQAKDDLNARLRALNDELNHLLCKNSSLSYEKWLETHQPFHWFSEFYEILQGRGGFDIIIGNPPYVRASAINYLPPTPEFSCGDLYGFVTRRALQLLNENSRFGFIVMHSLAFSKNFKDVRALLKAHAANAWVSFYGRIPAGLFSGDVRVRNCIFLLEKQKSTKTGKHFYTTRLHRWFGEGRKQLISKLKYTPFAFDGVIPMFNDTALANYFTTAKGIPLEMNETRTSKHKLYFKQSAYNWIAVSPAPAPCFDGRSKKIPQSKVSSFSLNSEDTKQLALLFLNGKVFFSHWLTFGDEFDVTKDDIVSFKVPFEKISAKDKALLLSLAAQFENELESTVQFKLNAGKNVGTYNTSKLWHITDQSDRIFLKYQCENPEEVYAAIEEHIAQTVITGTNESTGAANE